MKSAAELMDGIKIWQDFYFLTPGLSTSANYLFQQKSKKISDVIGCFGEESTVVDDKGEASESVCVCGRSHVSFAYTLGGGSESSGLAGLRCAASHADAPSCKSDRTK